MYSNTTLASSIAITMLLVISCSIISYMYYSYFIDTLSNKNASFWSINNKTTYIIQNSITISNVLASYINWFILFIGLILLTIKYRYQINYNMLLSKSNFIIICLYFLFIIITLIV